MNADRYGTHVATVYNMTIRIDVNCEGPEDVVYLAGRLTGDAAQQLRDTCDAIDETFVLDLSKLLFTDDTGIEVLRVIREQGAQIRGASQFIQLLANEALGSNADDKKC